MNIFSFLTSTNYTFEGKKEGEEVILFLHRHWFTLASKIGVIIAGGLLPFVILVIFGQFIIAHDLLSIFTLIWSAYYMVLWYVIFYSLTMYTLDTWIVTNMRIINSVQHGFFNRRISELNLNNVQDVSINMEGAVPTMMNYGNVEVQTAAVEHRFLFEQVPNPQQVKDEVMKAVTEHKLQSQHGAQNL